MTGIDSGSTLRSWPAEFEQILRRHCPLADPARPIDAGASLALLGMESFEVLAMIVDIEDTFELTVPDTMLTGDQFATASSVWECVRVLRSEPGNGDG